MVTAEEMPLPPRADARPRFGQYQVGDRVLLGISVVVDEFRDPDVAQVCLTGALCPASAPSLAATLDALVDDDGVTCVHVDLAGLELCTAAGASLFEDLRRRLDALGGSLHLTNATGVVHRVLEITQVPHHSVSED